jgi:hypothetical protein
MLLEEVYILIEERQKAIVDNFINNYLKPFEELSDYYEYPPYSDDIEFETSDFNQMLSFIFEKENRYFHFYFNLERHSYIKRGMIFFNADGSVLLGLGLGVESNKIAFYTNKLSEDFNSPFILICNNVLPPNNRIEFKSLVGF